MNQIEIWNGIITRKLIRCGTFRSVKALDREIDAFVKHWNSDCKHIKWTATAEEIINKVRAVKARMETLLRATEIDDVARQAA
jgi:methionyl-tRNA formyltransferase